MDKIEKVEGIIREQASNGNSSAVQAYAMMRVETRLAELIATIKEATLPSHLQAPAKVSKHDAIADIAAANPKVKPT